MFFIFSLEEMQHNKQSIQTLNEDILIMIFRLLPIRDKILFERTCSQWHKLLRQSWTRYNHLDFSLSLWGAQPFYSLNDTVLNLNSTNANMIKSAIIRCGSYLKTINFDHLGLSKQIPNIYKFKCTNNCLLKVIGKCCIRLQTIKIRICCIDGLKALADSCSTLKSMHFFGQQHFDFGVVNKLLHSIIQKNDNLNSIKLNDVKSTKFLLDMHQKLEKLSLCVTECYDTNSENILASCIEHSSETLKIFALKTIELDFHIISNALQLCKKLTKLKIHVQVPAKHYTELQYSKIFSQCRKLENISIKGLHFNHFNEQRQFLGYIDNYWLNYINPMPLKKLSLFADAVSRKYLLKELPIFFNLKSLCLTGIESDDERKIGDSIGMFINLESFKLSECNLSMKTSQDHYLFKRLTKLKNLIIQFNYSRNLDENDLVRFISLNLSEIESLTLGLIDLTDFGLKYLLILPKLQSLSLFGNYKLCGSNLFKLRNLRYLECLGCKTLQDTSIKLLIKESINLNELIIFHCPQITSDILKCAIRIKKLRKSNESTLTITGNIRNIRAHRFKQFYPGVDISLVDLN